MGLEPIELAKQNIKDIWVEPTEYSYYLKAAVEEFAVNNINISIYNHQLCTLDHSLWKYAVKSISDWKNEYLSQCDECSAKSICGGFFSSALNKHSNNISPLLQNDILL
jgi:radical SAM protein with 4Fe4S-binding SPASM domain